VYIKKRKLSNVILSLGLGLIISSVVVVQSGAQSDITNPPNTFNASGGSLSGESYVSSDSSAIGGNKVSFGNSNSVSFQSLKSYSSSIKLITGNINASSPISPLDYGANEIWYDGGYGTQNLANNELYSNVINQTKNIGINIIRFPGGIPSDTYHWQNAIGAQSNRTDNVVYQAQNVFFPSNFGSDEFGKLLQETNSAGDITVNFGTGTAQEAANWVQYMTASSKNNYWGELRAKNGHPNPYNIKYWEVGNETQSSSGENYWRSGSVVSIGSNNYQCNSTDIHLCEYVYGGTTSFNRQVAINSNNSTNSDGTASQNFYALYPPIVSGSQIVRVNGSVWRQVSDLSLYSSYSHVYLLDDTTGKISFGDGVHGAIPPANSIVTISYQSGPHDGFIQYYNLIKAADPSAKVCSSYEAIDFIQLMGSTNQYDCFVSHLYAGQVPSTNSSVSLFHNSLLLQSFSFANTISNEQSAIKQFAGVRASSIPVLATEYGVNALTSPAGQPDYHRSQDMALFVANTLREIIVNHVPVAEKHYLVSYQNSSPPGLQTYINSTAFSDNALLGGPGSSLVLQPSAYVMEAYSKLLYTNLINSTLVQTPSIRFSGGSYPALADIATTDHKGDLSILVINFEESGKTQLEIDTNQPNLKHIQAWTLGSNSYLAYNTPSVENAVNFVKSTSTLHDGKVLASFAPSSVTVLRFTK